MFVVGRIKNTIIVNGVKHSAEDIEAIALRSHALFAGVVGAAFAIDTAGQERPVLVQEIRREGRKAEEAAEAISSAFTAVTREYGLRLFDLALVRAGALPRTSSGKVRRARAREFYLSGSIERLNPPGALFARAPLQASAVVNNADDDS